MTTRYEHVDHIGDGLRAAYRHHRETGHTIRIQRIRMTEVSRP